MTQQPETPDWVKHAIFYQIFPDRFAKSAGLEKPNNLEPWDSDPTPRGYKGGDLVGVRERLDFLQELGVTAIYFTPIFQSASNHRYHTHDYYRIDPLLGGDKAFDELLAECHRRGLRVVLDGVFNHASRGFFQFNDILENGEASPWLDWFTFTKHPANAYDHGRPPDYTAWVGLHALPKFNTDNPQVREYLMRVGEYWLRKGIDGWRLDVAPEITSEGFWAEFRERMKAVNPKAYLVGEIWGDASPWLQGDQFDGTMNYLFTEAAIAFCGGRHILMETQDVYAFARRLDGCELVVAVNVAETPREVDLMPASRLEQSSPAQVLFATGGDVTLTSGPTGLSLALPARGGAVVDTAPRARPTR
ncbi:MAG: cyclomaltodextrinase / maltogenic alpha-amylase / neopullulanase [Thermomicrobiales bacterium]|jgi:cyclomaltodextrinase|nr:cyclomaltodextrinase / maltogenic alpha-amylase / neopullulanase [Thermomicrobiales bacterium]